LQNAKGYSKFETQPGIQKNVAYNLGKFDDKMKLIDDERVEI